MLTEVFFVNVFNSVRVIITFFTHASYGTTLYARIKQLSFKSFERLENLFASCIGCVTSIFGRTSHAFGASDDPSSKSFVTLCLVALPFRR